MRTLRPLFSLTLLGKILFIPVLLLTTALMNQDKQDDVPDPSVQRELESFHLADGFEVSLFAAEPLVAKPIQMNWDADGRLWVVSSTAYPHLKTGEHANDKIFILEDTDGDGKADKSTVFAEGLLTPTGILPGDGGVYVANSTEILHLSDTDGDGKADKKRRILSGFGTGDTHHLIHTFRWGPEGSLYFNQSIYIYSHVETPSGIKRLEGGGVWQLRPNNLNNLELSVYARGLVNPWGLQFNRWGQTFLTDGAGFEGINFAFPGATFLTSPGADRILRGLNPGQPKHSGLDVISGRHLPESWQNSVITNDFRANRINRFKLDEQGSGYASKQLDDLMWTDHVAFRPVDISVGPDGAIYVADWYNPIIQHGEVDFHDPRRDQQHGRIWRITAKNRPLVKKPQLTKASIQELLDALRAPEDWTRLQAKQVLKSRGNTAVIPALDQWVSGLNQSDADYEHLLLEALWTYQTLNVVNEPLLLKLLNAKDHNARAAALRALQLWHSKISNVPALLAKAVVDPHPRVRLESVIALRDVPSAEAARSALMVLDHPMDEFLDFALWQTVRQLEPQWLSRLKADAAFLGDTRKTAFALKSVSNPEAVAQLVKLYQKRQVPEEYHKDVLASIAKWGTVADLNTLFDMTLQQQNQQTAAELGALAEAARQRKLKPTTNLNRITTFLGSEEPAIVTNAIRLIGLWRLEELNGQLVSLIQQGDKSIKKTGLGALAAMDSETARKLLVDMTGPKHTPELRILATIQLVPLDAPEATRIGTDLLRTLPPQTDVSELFGAFFTNKPSIPLLAEAITTKKIPEAFAKVGRQQIQRQIPGNRQKADDVLKLKQALEASGGTLPPEGMPQELTSQEITVLAKVVKETSDPVRGEMIFRRSELMCQSCHALGGAGGRIGPDLSSLGTSSPVETIIRSILFPTQSIKEGYELQRVIKKDGTEMLAYLVSNGSSEVVVRDVTGTEVSIPKSQINSIEKTPGSLMPSGLTSRLAKQEFIDLVGFLSKIGESGQFRVPTARFIRRWQTVSPSKELSKRLKDDDMDYMAKANGKLAFRSIYSKVSGELPVSDLPIIDGGPTKQYSVVRFDLEVVSKGNVEIGLNSTAGITAWVGSKRLKLTDQSAIADLPQGIHSVMLAIDRAQFKEANLAVQIRDAQTGSAQVRLIMGQ